MATEARDAKKAAAALAEGLQVAAKDPRRGEQVNLDVASASVALSPESDGD